MREPLVGNGGCAPALKFCGQIIGSRPTRGEGEAALRMVGGPQGMEAPEGSRQQAIREGVALAPPLIPDEAYVIVGASAAAGQFGRQQAADAEEPGLEGEQMGGVGGREGGGGG